jgi:predicted hydrolase (HD superfamily)
MKRQEALRILEELGNSPNMIKHALAAEAVMRMLALRFEPEKEEEYAICGLLHDADYEITGKSLERHTEITTEKLRQLGINNEEIIEAIRGHCNKASRTSMMAKAIYAVDELTGLIVATALVMPDPPATQGTSGQGKKLSQVTVESVMKKFKDPSFARGANRELIKTCEAELALPLEEFIRIALVAMKQIAPALGL